MEKLTYLNEYTKVFELVNRRGSFDEKFYQKSNTKSAKDVKRYSQVKRKSNYMSPPKIKERCGYKELYCYKENKEKSDENKNHNTNEHVPFNTSVPAYNLNVGSKPKNNIKLLKRDANETNDLLRNRYEKVCICKRCYLNGVQEKMKKWTEKAEGQEMAIRAYQAERMREKKKRTTVYTLEFNNFIDCENKYQDVTYGSKTKEYQMINMRKESHKYSKEYHDLIEKTFSGQIPLKKNIFKLLNSIFSMN
ncbi:conserved Plasmodium protein, unknown function [Plasmodium ovale]|uniref:Uncharacterized protein n=2 Tax=Plasmodium ovale TaxID=36330 RepID=A0A1A8WNN1_PLAOA|nr:conserved Plasmodium protein, unknown function [Plasmodium ovale curtisi]SBS92933.1 conserved Plasmodium protein, unknown function [Plasmodium ovale curtisi]SCQ16540.1 conserved Plasmodium protein, unknown function [Plasmodium ovale]